MSITLATYMEREGIDDAAFATLIGKDRTTVSRLRRGLIRPSLELAADIEKVTGGCVPMGVWLAAA